MTTDYIAFDRAFAAEYQLHVAVGQASAPDGITQLRLDGVGALQAAQARRAPATDDVAKQEKQVRDQQVERAEGKIAPEEAARLMEQASMAPWGQRFPLRPGIPDEAIVEVRFERLNRGSGSIKLWLRDAEKDQALGPVLGQLRRHLKEFSGGRIYL